MPTRGSQPAQAGCCRAAFVRVRGLALTPVRETFAHETGQNTTGRHTGGGEKEEITDRASGHVGRGRGGKGREGGRNTVSAFTDGGWVLRACTSSERQLLFNISSRPNTAKNDRHWPKRTGRWLASSPEVEKISCRAFGVSS